MISEKYQEKNISRDRGWQRVASVNDKRIHERIIVRLKAVLTFEEISYVGLIENISEHGFYMISLSIKQQIDYRTGSIHEMKVRSMPGKSLLLHCKSTVGIQNAASRTYKQHPDGNSEPISVVQGIFENTAVNKSPEIIFSHCTRRTDSGLIIR
jgi:hypothetical protein